MSMVVSLVLLVGLSQSYAIPINIPSPLDLPSDYLSPYNVPWPFSAIGSMLAADPTLGLVNPVALGADILPRIALDYAPKTVDVARENFIRGSVYGFPEVGTRNEVTIRPSGPRPPYSRFYSSYYPYNYLRCSGRYSPSDLDYDLCLRRPYSPLSASLLTSTVLPGIPDAALYLRK